MEHRAKMGKRNYLLVGYVISDSVEADYSYHSIIMYHYHSPFTFMSIVHSIDFAELPFSQCLSRNKLSKWLNCRSIHTEAFHKKLFREISQNLQNTWNWSLKWTWNVGIDFYHFHYWIWTNVYPLVIFETNVQLIAQS